MILLFKLSQNSYERTTSRPGADVWLWDVGWTSSTTRTWEEIFCTLVQTCQPPKGKKCEILNLEKSGAGKSSEKWVKSHEMSQISYRGDFQWGLWVLEVTYHLKAAGSKHHDQFYNLGLVISMFCWWSSQKRETVSLHIWWQNGAHLVHIFFSMPHLALE